MCLQKIFLIIRLKICFFIMGRYPCQNPQSSIFKICRVTDIHVSFFHWGFLISYWTVSLLGFTVIFVVLNYIATGMFVVNKWSTDINYSMWQILDQNDNFEIKNTKMYSKLVQFVKIKMPMPWLNESVSRKSVDPKVCLVLYCAHIKSSPNFH